jgi:Ion channel
MSGKLQLRPDSFLLLSLLLVILLNPVLDHGDWRRLVLGTLMFIPVILSTVSLSQIKVRMWPAVSLMVGVFVFAVLSNIFANRLLHGMHWGFLAAFFALTAARLFSHLQNSRSVSRADLYTAVSIYLLLGATWAALYGVMEALHPGSFQLGTHSTDRQSDLLYFSLVTLSTIGYGDIVPLTGEARMLAALEGVIGVLYIAITVAILVSGYRRGSSDSA